MGKTTTVGMDLGDKKHQVCVLDEAGEIIEQCCIANTLGGLEKFFKRRESSVGARATGGQRP